MENTNKANTEPDPQQHKQRSREHTEELLDEALKETFPASDPPAVSRPEDPAPARNETDQQN
ncbi:MAG: hypothetical protein JF593_12675 [Novosphingobium sp.]|nr:hypothetical protein [Novosphingobium sp.]